MKHLFTLLSKYRTFIIYAIIGVSGVMLDLISFYLMNSFFHINHQIANFISTSLGIINNFFWNAFLNFKVNDKLIKRFVSFYMVGMTGLILTAIILYIFVDTLHFNPSAVKAGSLFFVLVVQYSLNKNVSFKRISDN